jgi:hypothetical protein
MIFTAGAVAYRNLVNEMEAPQTTLFPKSVPGIHWSADPCRCVGVRKSRKSKEAAEFAFRDACLSHAKNGIYGEMWASACIAQHSFIKIR